MVVLSGRGVKHNYCAPEAYDSVKWYTHKINNYDIFSIVLYNTYFKRYPIFVHSRQAHVRWSGNGKKKKVP